ncbi:hypothetical protein BRAS3843_720019 [Bradyrhizobium sp. STM 3843]|nr:hypothetical protein BRAS3843_720019 [Bradyrhizobium sp. STM 3843]
MRQLMSKFTPEEAAEIIAQGRETLQRVDAALVDRSHEQISAGDPTGQFVRFAEPRVETTNQRHAREITEQDKRFEIEREREKRERADIAANAAAEQRIAGLEAEVLGLARATNTVIEALEGELAHVTSENRELKLSRTRLETRLAELQLKVTENAASDRGNKILDLPNPLSSSVN